MGMGIEIPSPTAAQDSAVSMGIPMGVTMGMGMGWVWGQKFRPHGSRAKWRHRICGHDTIISVSPGFRRHLVNKTLIINVFTVISLHEICFVGKLVITQTFSKTNGSNVI